MKNVLIVLDIGTSSIKCGSIDAEFSIVESAIQDFEIWFIFMMDIFFRIKEAMEADKKLVMIKKDG